MKESFSKNCNGLTQKTGSAALDGNKIHTVSVTISISAIKDSTHVPLPKKIVLHTTVLKCNVNCVTLGLILNLPSASRVPFTTLDLCP